jgi:hypothetical protein
MARFFRIIGPYDLDKLAVPRAAAIGYHDFIIRAVQGPFSA